MKRKSPFSPFLSISFGFFFLISLVEADRGFLEAFGSACTLLGICLSQRPTEKEASRARSAIRSVDMARDWPLGGSDVLALAADLIEQGVIEVAPLAFMRGRTMNDAFVSHYVPVARA